MAVGEQHARWSQDTQTRVSGHEESRWWNGKGVSESKFKKKDSERKSKRKQGKEKGSEKEFLKTLGMC